MFEEEKIRAPPEILLPRSSSIPTKMVQAAVGVNAGKGWSERQESTLKLFRCFVQKRPDGGIIRSRTMRKTMSLSFTKRRQSIRRSIACEKKARWNQGASRTSFGLFRWQEDCLNRRRLQSKNGPNWFSPDEYERIVKPRSARFNRERNVARVKTGHKNAG
ncbi:uncharacterized protein K452DRAFT_4520 [Aplosporella prunicola CBS 121167]|uniref:Uncharacterized protein n=1 Tax=Aplosporella prunicola CBS 121167 TaxID=1176127 RepID=A0A6A6BVH3_9PEZI|nr:uncharacterized protein K452DRAFT_4520 [Aplosporella prunicola CBS 121167]KAF2147275.1 hypothetical protein K452DRAFT_4520 [Aplosporella prunicola CBS 121167]